MNNSTVVIMDVETGGLDPHKNPITQIGLLAIDGATYKPIIQYDTFVKPYAGLEILDRALQASRVSMVDVNNGKDIEVAIKEMAKVLSSLSPKKARTNKPILVGHNVTFDIGFLTAACQMFQVDFMKFFNSMFYDTLVMMRRSELGTKLEKGIKYTLEACCERLDITLSNAHDAMADIYATTEVFKVLDSRLRNSIGGIVNTPDKFAKKPGKKSRKHFDFCDF